MEPTVTQSVMDWFLLIKDILVVLSALAAVIIAYRGLMAWRQQLKGTSEYQLAKDILKSAYRVQNSFRHVRNPGIFAYEYPEEMTDQTGHLKSEFNYVGTVHVYQKRWEKLGDAFLQLYEKTLDAKVEWGTDFQSIIKLFNSCKWDLNDAIQSLLERKKEKVQTKIDPEEAKRERKILYYGFEDDMLDKKIDEAVHKFEEWLRPIIDSDMTIKQTLKLLKDNQDGK